MFIRHTAPALRRRILPDGNWFGALMTTATLPAQKTRLLPIQDIANKLGLLPGQYEPIGAHGAKLKLDLLTNPAFPVRGKFILVTATTPTVSGEGKTVVSIGLAQGLERIGCKSIVTSREPSLGPVFGLKGGAAGGGLSQVEPSQKINLHFHGHHRRPQPACRNDRLAPFPRE
jgi:formyltetrahydrofolate synthetase